MMIIAILATVVIINFNFTGVNARNNLIAANELRSHLTYIRNMAVSQEKTLRVRFDVVSNRYDVFAAVSNWTGSYLPAKDPVIQKDWVVDLSNKFSGVTLSSVNINGNSTLYFSETNGIPLDVNRIRLATTGTVTFASGLKVTVAPDTGYAGLE